MTGTRVVLLTATSVVLAGCGAAEGSPEGAESRRSTTAAGSSTATSSTSSAPPTPDRAEAGKRGLAALLPDAAMAKAGFDVKQKRAADKWTWFITCHNGLQSDRQIAGGGHARWSDGKRTFDQVVDVYPSGTAQEVVAETRERVDCTDYVTPQGFEVSGVKELKLPTVKGAKAQFGWCENVKGVSQCHAVIATDDLLTRLWLISDPISDTKEGIAAFTLLAGARLVDQP